MKYIVKDEKHYFVDTIEIPVLGDQAHVSEKKEDAKIFTDKKEAERMAYFMGKKAIVIPLN